MRPQDKNIVKNRTKGSLFGTRSRTIFSIRTLWLGGGYHKGFRFSCWCSSPGAETRYAARTLWITLISTVDLQPFVAQSPHSTKTDDCQKKPLCENVEQKSWIFYRFVRNSHMNQLWFSQICTTNMFDFGFVRPSGTWLRSKGEV